MAKIANDHRVVGIKTLHPNPWNINEMTPRAFEALKESIEDLGFVEAPVVRRSPKKRQHWEIIGGEHRWRAAQAVGMTKIPILHLPWLDGNDEKARKAVVMLNNKGEAEHLKMAQELAALYELFKEETTRGLPLSHDELEEMIALAEAMRPELQDGEMPGKPSHADFITIVFHVPREAEEVVERALSKAMTEGESDSRGVAIERICADYLAG